MPYARLSRPSFLCIQDIAVVIIMVVIAAEKIKIGSKDLAGSEVAKRAWAYNSTSESCNDWVASDHYPWTSPP